MEMLKQAVESQQELAALLRELGLGLGASTCMPALQVKIAKAN
jgi:hypothetical protein